MLLSFFVSLLLASGPNHYKESLKALASHQDTKALNLLAIELKNNPDNLEAIHLQKMIQANLAIQDTDKKNKDRFLYLTKILKSKMATWAKQQAVLVQKLEALETPTLLPIASFMGRLDLEREDLQTYQPSKEELVVIRKAKKVKEMGDNIKARDLLYQSYKKHRHSPYTLTPLVNILCEMGQYTYAKQLVDYTAHLYPRQANIKIMARYLPDIIAAADHKARTDLELSLATDLILLNNYRY